MPPTVRCLACGWRGPHGLILLILLIGLFLLAWTIVAAATSHCEMLWTDEYRVPPATTAEIAMVLCGKDGWMPTLVIRRRLIWELPGESHPIKDWETLREYRIAPKATVETPGLLLYDVTGLGGGWDH